MKTKMLFSFLFAAGILSAADNLVQNGDFESKGGWLYGGAFGGDPGSAGITDKTAKGGKNSLRFYKAGPKGGAQIFTPRRNLENRDATELKLNFSFDHKGKGLLVFIRFHDEDTKKPVKDLLGRDLTVKYEIKGSKEWNRFSAVIPIPAVYLKHALGLSLQFQMWGAGEAFVDNVRLTADKKSAAKPAPVEKKGKAPVSDFLTILDPPDHSTVPPLRFPFEYGQKNGVLTRNGKAWFYTGNSSFGGGQYSPEGIWLARLLNYSMVTLDWGISHRLSQKDGKLVISFPDPASSVSMFRELARNNLLVEHDTGNAAYIYMPARYWEKKFPRLREIFVPGNHFYSFDHNTEEGRRIHVNAWKNRYRFMKGFPIMATEIYNELGYTPTHERVLVAFRDFAKKKYGTLEEASRTWKKKFESWDEVYPPHLDPSILDGAQAHGLRVQMRQKYWEMYYDWLRFCQLDLVPGLIEMKKEFRKFSDAPFFTDWRGHRGESDGYCAADPDLQQDIQDVIGLHTSSYHFDYKDTAADAPSVMQSLTHNIMHYDFALANSKKPIFNPECIISRTTPSGSNLNSMIQNSFKNFNSAWKFKLENTKDGLEKGYFKPEFDDSKWGWMNVPGCWDETPEYRGKKGFGWYRTTFHVPANLKLDYEDGSRKFCLFGKGVAQKGTVWINGVKIGDPQGWAATYRYDVSPHLKYGKENQITFLVDGSNYANGLRFYVCILPEDRISETRMLEKRDYASMLWSMMMHGCSGVVLWHWDSQWRPFMAELNQQLASVGELAMPEARNRKARAAMLMPFLYFRGLPTPLDKYFLDYTNYYGSFLFRQTPVDMLTEGNILKATPEKYPLIVYPYARVVFPETYRHFENYVRNGGTALVTLDSLSKDFHRYQNTALESFAGIRISGDYTGKPEFRMNGKNYPIRKGDMCGKAGVKIQTNNRILATYADGSPAVVEKKIGKGRVIFSAVNPDYFGAEALIARLLKETNIRPALEIVDSGDKSEYPYLEAQRAGNEERFLIYFHNWGGKKRSVTFKLPFSGLYRARDVRNPEAGTKQARNTFTVSVDPTEPAAWLFEAERTKPMILSPVAPEKRQIIKQLDQISRKSGNAIPEKPNMLFISEPQYATASGLMMYPAVAWYLKKIGVHPLDVTAAEATPELLKKFDAVFLAEGVKSGVWSMMNPKSAFRNSILDYVKNGGNLFVAGSSVETGANCQQLLHAFFGRSMDFHLAEYVRNDQSCGYGDPYQLRVREFGKAPAVNGVKEVQFFVTRYYKTGKKCTLKPLLFDRKRPVALFGNYGKGKVYFFSDILWMQPLRIEEADNMQFLMNVLQDLANRPIRVFSREELRKALPYTGDALIQMEKKEGR